MNVMLARASVVLRSRQVVAVGRRLCAMSEPTCALCDQPIQGWENVVFRADDLVAHVGCERSRKPLARLVPPRTPDLVCPACLQPIRPAESVAKEGADVVHIRCLGARPRQIAGGCAPDPWTLIGEWHVGRHLGLTRIGHAEFMIACAEVRSASTATAASARRAVAEARARRGTAA
jgi:hypothetical protein